jgi:type VI secretion system protein ImpA
MIPLDKLLIPVRDGAPCGDDPWATGILSELETLVQGKPETQFSAAEEPDWVQLRARVLEVAGTTRDLRVAAILATTLLHTDGLAGFRSGLQLIRGYLENFWPDVFPSLDATDNNDPSERINAVGNLAAPLGTDGDLLKIVPSLRKIPLLAATRTGRFALEHYLAVREQTPWPEEAGPAPTMALLDAAKQEVGAAAVATVATTVRDILADLEAIERIFREKAGPTQFPSVDPLRQVLKQISSWLGGAAAAPGTAASPADGAAGVRAATGSEADGPGLSGTVRSREDVLRALEAIIAYYQRSEPSSPVPFLLKRAVRIVPMDFLEVMKELTPETREKIMTVVGAVDSSAPSS